jgi:hypothetical protein
MNLSHPKIYKDKMRHTKLFCTSVFFLTVVSALEIETAGPQPTPPKEVEAVLNQESGNSDTNSDLDAGDQYHCVWYDKCGPDPDYQDNVHNLNCVYQGQAGQQIVNKLNFLACCQQTLC